MKLNPLTGEMEDDEAVPGVAPVAPIAPQAPVIENPMVRDYLMKRQAERGDLQSQVDKDSSGPNWLAALSALGAGIGGKDAGAAGQSFLKMQQDSRDKKLTDFDSSTDRYVKNTDSINSAEKMDREKSLLKAEDDPNSEESKMATELAKKMGYGGGPITATKFKAFSPVMEKLYEAQQKDLDRKEARDERRFQSGVKIKEKQDEAAKLSDKQIEAFTDLDNAKTELNNILGQLGKNSNWTGPVDGRIPDMMTSDDQVAWRSAVGKYKDAYRKAVTGTGASPSEISRLESRLPSETDTFANFNAKANEALSELSKKKANLSSNLAKGGKNVSNFVDSPASGKKEIVKTQTNKKTGQKRNVYSDGSVEVVDSKMAGQ